MMMSMMAMILRNVDDYNADDRRTGGQEDRRTGGQEAGASCRCPPPAARVTRGRVHPGLHQSRGRTAEGKLDVAPETLDCTSVLWRCTDLITTK